MKLRIAAACAACTLLCGPAGAAAPAGQPATFPVRGKSLTLTVYRPAGPPKGTVIMGSGDVGWVGLGVSLAEFLSGEGYVVVGVNVRQYLSAFTAAKTHLEVSDPPADYLAISEWMKASGLLAPPVIVSGVSEGAALAVLAAASAKNHAWLNGAITMGIPPTAELAWKWTDFTAWITKGDAREPSFAPKDFIASVSPLPLVMLQSRKDEYVPEADYRLLDSLAKPPKKLVLIDASNHRFTDRRPQLQAEYLAAIAWIRSQPR
ncbi:MAG TPA: alpha/beta hydrolase [Vicinamibacterales bacterium]|nr:alpha/beta hydrolase [Vicinamibacterales bacterium]